MYPICNSAIKKRLATKQSAGIKIGENTYLETFCM
jgi:hypothetical protein